MDFGRQVLLSIISRNCRREDRLRDLLVTKTRTCSDDGGAAHPMQWDSRSTQLPPCSSTAPAAATACPQWMLLAPYGGGIGEACNITGDTKTIAAAAPSPPTASASPSPSVVTRPRCCHASASASCPAQRIDSLPIPPSSRRTAAPFS